MPETPTASPPQETEKPYEYTLKFEPVGDFNETELFVKGFVKGRLWLSDKMTVVYRSLIGTEVDAINEAVKIVPGMTITHFNTEQTYHNLAHSIEEVGGKKFEGTLEEKLQRIRPMAGPILARLSLAYLEFGHHVDDLFKTNGGLETAKKS